MKNWSFIFLCTISSELTLPIEIFDYDRPKLPLQEPDLKVNLEIMEARNLIGKDMSGSSDPFCTFYLTTNPKSRYNTSYKSKTLNPQWNEECVL